MKVLMVTPFYYPVIGGTEIFIENMAVRLNEIGVHTDVMAFNVSRNGKPFLKAKTETVRGVNVIKIPAFDISPLKAIDRIFQIKFIPGRFASQFENYDVIHFHNDVDLSFPTLSYFVTKPKIFHCHCLAGTYYLFRKSFLSKKLFRNVANIYIVSSQFLVKYLCDLGIPRKKIAIVPIGVDVRKFKPHGKNKVENLLLFVGRLEPVKGLHVLLKSLNYLKTPVQLAIIAPQSYDQTYFENMLRLIEQTKEKTIHTLTYVGWLEREQIIEWYRNASVLVRPDVDGCSGGLTALEALACGTPVIGTGNDVVKHGSNGIIVPPNDAVRLAKGIQYLLDNEDLRQKFGKEGRRFIVKHFSFEAVAERLFQIYKEMVD